MSLFWGTCRRPARPCTRPHVDEPRGGVVVLTILSKAKEVSGTRSRRAASPGRSRAFWQNSLAGPVNEVTMVVVVVGSMSKRTRSRPWRRYPDPYQPLGTRGDAGSTRWRPRAPTSPYGDGLERSCEYHYSHCHDAHKCSLERALARRRPRPSTHADTAPIHVP